MLNKPFFILLSILMLIFMQLYSQTVSENLAKKIAVNYYKEYASQEIEVLQSKQGLKNKWLNYIPDTTIIKTYVKNLENEIYYYVFSFSDRGFIIISGDKSTNPVIGFSIGGNFDHLDMPPALQLILSDLEKLIVENRKRGVKNTDKQKKWLNLENGISKLNFKSGNGSGIYPDFFLTTEWGQTRTNNGSCPGYNFNPNIPSNSSCTCSKCAAGCVAVAIAQIMNFWGFAGGYNADFEWWNMPYPGLISTDADFNYEMEAVSYLLWRIGVEVEMEYDCSSAASSKDADEAFIQYRYNPNTLNYQRKPWHTYTSWLNMIENEIRSGRPVYYRVENHATVVDGYNPASGNFHWNLGWNGNYNMWIDFEDFIAGGYDFTDISEHKCWIGITPLINDNVYFNENVDLYDNYTWYVKYNIIAPYGSYTFRVRNNAKASLIAGNSIELNPGFSTDLGASLNCTIYNETNFFKSTNSNFEYEALGKQRSISKSEYESSRVSIIPNPTNGLTKFFVRDFDGLFNYVMFDMSGNQVISGSMTNNTEVDLSILNKGSYILRFNIDNEVFTEKLVIR